jgi:hypothetical protein
VLRPPGWKRNLEIEQRFNGIAAKHAGFRTAMESARIVQAPKQAAKAEEDILVMAVTSTAERNVYSAASPYILRDSFIADTGTDIHVYNDIRRFFDYTPDDGRLRVGDTHDVFSR